MSILCRFTPAGLTREQYDEVNRRLGDDGAHPDGRELHVCFGEDGDLRVSEIWESEEKMQAFGEKLSPILGDVGVKMGADPEYFPIANLEQP